MLAPLHVKANSLSLIDDKTAGWITGRKLLGKGVGFSVAFMNVKALVQKHLQWKIVLLHGHSWPAYCSSAKKLQR